MPAWRGKARQLFPNRASQLNRAFTLPDLLFGLAADVHEAYHATPPDAATIERVYEFVRWCLAGKQNAARREVVIERFLLHLAAMPEARADIPRLTGKATFLHAKPTFEARLEPSDYQATLLAFMAHQLIAGNPEWADA